MNKLNFTSFFFFCLLLSFYACTHKDEPLVDDTPEGFKLVAPVINDITVNVDRVEACLSYFDILTFDLAEAVIASAVYENGGFVIYLPDSLNAVYLEDLEYLLEQGLSASDSTIYMSQTNVVFYAVRDGIRVGTFRKCSDWDRDLSAEYFYSTGWSDLRGSFPEGGTLYRYNNSFNVQKGWNAIYPNVYYESGMRVYEWVLNRIGEDFQWYYYSWE